MSETEKPKSAPVSKEQVEAIQKFIEKVGGVERAKLVLQTLKQLREAS